MLLLVVWVCFRVVLVRLYVFGWAFCYNCRVVWLVVLMFEHKCIACCWLYACEEKTNCCGVVSSYLVNLAITFLTVRCRKEVLFDRAMRRRGSLRSCDAKKRFSSTMWCGKNVLFVRVMWQEDELECRTTRTGRFWWTDDMLRYKGIYHWCLWWCVFEWMRI